jgi:hypothetical protein
MIRPIVEAVLPLNQAREAYERGIRDHPRGKLVLACPASVSRAALSLSSHVRARHRKDLTKKELLCRPPAASSKAPASHRPDDPNPIGTSGSPAALPATPSSPAVLPSTEVAHAS